MVNGLQDVCGIAGDMWVSRCVVDHTDVNAQENLGCGV